MLLHIPQVLSADNVAAFREALDTAAWIDGCATAGVQSGQVKTNRQLAEDDPLARRLGAQVLAALHGSPLFTSGALPATLYPPMFSRYESGEQFGFHVDGAVRARADAPRIRTDLAMTLFLSEPETYDGGELTIDDTFGLHQVKLPAGDLILYPASSLHRVEPVTRGARLAAVLWGQSMVRDDGQRTLLFDLDRAIQAAGADLGGGHDTVVALTAVYHNLLRRWAEL